MKNKPSSAEQLSQAEIQLIEQLRKHPEIRDRVQSILELASNAEGTLKTADQVEDLLIEQVRQLGNATMREWATQAEARVGNWGGKEASCATFSMSVNTWAQQPQPVALPSLSSGDTLSKSDFATVRLKKWSMP